MNWFMVCHNCNGKVALTEPPVCSRCAIPLSLTTAESPPADLMKAPPGSMWHYARLMPIEDVRHIVTLGEGATPLVDAPRLAEKTGIGRILLKNEMVNPTGSFKDRQVAAGISHARETGAGTVAVVSSGNVACATSAYAARAGMKSVMMMHGHAAPGKVAMAGVYGGIAVQVDTPSAMAVFDLCIRACARFGWYHLSTAGMYNPYNVEGAKTIAYEIYQQTGGELPDWVVAPVGGGGLLGAIWRGFEDLRRLRLIERAPRLAGVQAAGCAPLVRAMRTRQAVTDVLHEPWPNPHTVAGGIADDILFDGHSVLPALRNTRGAAIAVDDEAIIAGQAQLAVLEGLLCEPTSAVVIAAIPHIPDIERDTTVCLILTGSGFKDTLNLPIPKHPAVKVKPSIEALESALKG